MSEEVSIEKICQIRLDHSESKTHRALQVL